MDRAHLLLDDLPQVLTPAEVRRVLRVSPSTVYHLISEQRLPAVRLGRQFRVPRRALERLLSEADRGE